MNEDHKKILIESVKDAFALRDKFSDFEINSKFQLLLAQFDNFRTISSLVIGIAGIGYFFDPQLNNQFLITALILALFVLMFSISYTREVIDLQELQNKKIRRWINEQTDLSINKVLEALKKQDQNIFYDFAKSQIRTYPEASLNYAGEIVVFCFYVSIGFLALSFFSNRYNFEFISYQTSVTVFVAYLLSFKNWTIRLSEVLSKKINFNQETRKTSEVKNE